MERLTEHWGEGHLDIWVKDHDYVSAAHRLAAYEDTGLTPEQCESAKVIIESAFSDDTSKTERIRELLKADKSGCVVVLPCKVGDVVYGFHGEKTILPMVAKWIETNTDGWHIAVQYTPMAPRFYRFSDFGKTVFLTREEAKKALEAMKDGDKTDL
jgi:hypothetical protein